jgi:hypothetical protein
MVIHRLSPAEQRVLASFLAGRLPAGQVHSELAQARAGAQPAAPVTQATPIPAPAPTRAVAA